jgi:hypothetical protein
VSDDLTARVAELAAVIEASLAEDEAAANAMQHEGGEVWLACPATRTEPLGDLEWGEGRCDCGLAKRKDRALRRVKATRDLVAEILAERHLYVDGDPWFSCSQATEPGEEGEPGSACADDERRGNPCDCGRDATTARLLGIIASGWEGERHG